MAPRTLAYWAKASRRNIFLDTDDDSDSSCWHSVASSKTSLTTSSTSTGHAAENLPSTAEFASNHVMVNRARILWGLHPLYRSQHLDQLATQHAQLMAIKRRVFHSTKDASELRKQLGSCIVAGENIHRGPSIKKMHLWTLQNRHSKHRKNLQSERFHEMGVGTCRGPDGRLYMCQLFRGFNPEEWYDPRNSA